MNKISAVFVLWGVLLSATVHAAQDEVSDRLTFSANGSRLSGPHGGAGATAGILHNFNADSLLGAEVEYQTLADSHWTLGSLSGATTWGSTGHRTSLFGELHEGAGDIGPHAFHYSIIAVGMGHSFGQRLSLQVEDRQIDVDKTHGNLPKATASVLWTSSLQTSVSYSNSVSGNLGTELVSVRLDHLSAPLNWFAGGATGKASPAVVNLQTGIVQPGSTLKEVYAGASMPVRSARLTVVVDYLNLGGTKRGTLSASYIVPLERHGGTR